MLKWSNMVAVAVGGVILAASLTPADALSFRPVLGGGGVHVPHQPLRPGVMFAPRAGGSALGNSSAAARAAPLSCNKKSGSCGPPPSPKGPCQNCGPISGPPHVPEPFDPPRAT